MKIIKNGKRFDTDKSTLIYKSRHDHNDGRGYYEELYKTNKGSFFLLCRKFYLKKCDGRVEHQCIGKEVMNDFCELREVDIKNVMGWIDRNLVPYDVVEKHLSEFIQDA